MPWLPPPLPPAHYPSLLRHSTTWLPEEVGVPRAVVRLARQLAAQIANTVGRREAIARHLLALAACEAGQMACVARIPLFQAPGILVADPHSESFYWSLDPGVPASFEGSAVSQLAAALKAALLPPDADPAPAAVER